MATTMPSALSSASNKRPSKRSHPPRHAPTSPTLTDVVEELKGLRRDMVVLCRVIVDSQKATRTTVERTVKRAEQPGSLSANVQLPSWYDAIFEANRDAEGE